VRRLLSAGNTLGIDLCLGEISYTVSGWGEETETKRRPMMEIYLQKREV